VPRPNGGAAPKKAQHQPQSQKGTHSRWPSELRVRCGAAVNVSHMRNNTPTTHTHCSTPCAGGVLDVTQASMRTIPTKKGLHTVEALPRAWQKPCAMGPHSKACGGTHGARRSARVPPTQLPVGAELGFLKKPTLF